jgi:hypothetical protein
VLGVVLNYTTSYSKLIDRRGVEQIAEVAGRAATTTARALNVLDDAGIIRYTPGGQFRGHVSTIEIPLERGTTNSPPYEVERGTTNGPPKDGLGGRVGSV